MSIRERDADRADQPGVEVRGEIEVGVEGCLSFPEITGDIERAQSVLVRAQTLEGEMFQIEATVFSRARSNMSTIISTESCSSIE